mmetsp:Transcript_8647/g.28398  ORF Transcript_8647/g.28398 Transcript_8647/m.28398 type:complete len:290 (-) Transcript_8647:707-1576(-)
MRSLLCILVPSSRDLRTKGAVNSWRTRSYSLSAAHTSSVPLSQADPRESPRATASARVVWVPIPIEGRIGWAASPSRVTGPSPHLSDGSRSQIAYSTMASGSVSSTLFLQKSGMPSIKPSARLYLSTPPAPGSGRGLSAGHSDVPPQQTELSRWTRVKFLPSPATITNSTPSLKPMSCMVVPEKRPRHVIVSLNTGGPSHTVPARTTLLMPSAPTSTRARTSFPFSNRRCTPPSPSSKIVKDSSLWSRLMRLSGSGTGRRLRRLPCRSHQPTRARKSKLDAHSNRPRSQ